MELHARLREIVSFLDGTRSELLDVAERAPDTPAMDQGWSVAQVLQHVALAEVGTARYMTKRLQRAIEAGLPRETDMSSVLGSVDPQMVLDAPRMEAPDALVPPADVRTADALAALTSSRHELLMLIAAADGWDGKQVTGRHPFFGTLDLYQYLVFTGYHERRHAAQIARGRALRVP